MRSIMIGNCRLEIVADMSRVLIKVRGPDKNRDFVWKSGENPKWLTVIPVAGAEIKHLTMTRITWLLGSILKVDVRARGSVDKILKRGDVKDFFFAYLEERTTAETFANEWPWNLTVSDVDHIRKDIEAIKDEDDIEDPSVKEELDFLDGNLPSEDMPYWDDDLRDHGSADQREEAFKAWRKRNLKSLGLGKSLR